MRVATTSREIEDVMDQFPYGLYIIGSQRDGEPNGMMADWVMQVAFVPRLIAISLENDSHTLENVRANGHFTVNLLSQDQEGMNCAAKFAQPYYGSKVQGRGGLARSAIHHKLDDIPHGVTGHGCPVLQSAIAWLECEAKQFVETGDHTLLVGEVVDAELVRDAEVLTSTFTGWTYSG